MEADEHPRPETTLESLAKLKPAFKPDGTIMEATKFNFDTLATRLRELAFLNKGLKITLADERTDPVKSHEFWEVVDRGGKRIALPVTFGTATTLR